MDAKVSRSPVVFLVAATVAGCASTGQPVPTKTPGALTCEPIVWDKPIPETVPPGGPGGWTPEPKPRAYVHIRFISDGRDVYAVGVPVVQLEAVEPFIVGPMDNLPEAYPMNEEAARAALKEYPKWLEFYQKLFRAYRHWRPMGLVCPGKDCPTTPEGPPPSLYGMTVSYGTGGIGALESPESGRAYASLAQAPAPTTATDALKAPSSGAQRSPDLERDRRALVSDVVTRAVCAARVLAAPR
jgi:hypothetical protein